MADILVENHLSIYLLRPMSEAGLDWIEAHVDNDEAQYFGSALVCEPRYVGPIVVGMLEDGLEVL